MRKSPAGITTSRVRAGNVFTIGIIFMIKNLQGGKGEGVTDIQHILGRTEGTRYNAVRRTVLLKQPPKYVWDIKGVEAFRCQGSKRRHCGHSCHCLIK